VLNGEQARCPAGDSPLKSPATEAGVPACGRGRLPSPGSPPCPSQASAHVLAAGQDEGLARGWGGPRSRWSVRLRRQVASRPLLTLTILVLLPAGALLTFSAAVWARPNERARAQVRLQVRAVCGICALPAGSSGRSRTPPQRARDGDGSCGGVCKRAARRI